MVFGSTAYGHPSGGTPQSLQRITRADVLAMHASHYRPDEAVLVLAGDINLDMALRLARRHFGDWSVPQGLPQASEITLADTPQAAAAIDLASSGQAAVVVAAPLPPLGADRATAAVLNAVLGGGYSSRLNQEIRIKRGLSYGADSGIDARRQGGALRVVVQTKNESAPEVVGLVQAELDRLINTPVPEDELAARKATIIGEFSRSVETTAGLGASVASLIAAGRSPEDLGKRIGSLAAVSAVDVQRFAAAHLGVQRRFVAVAGDSAKFVDAMKALVPDLIILPAQTLQSELERSGALSSP
jgi:zinc protease